MREVIDIAVEKSVRMLWGRIDRAGLDVMDSQARDLQSFEEQLEGL